MKIHIETDRLILREWKEDDKVSFARINADPMIMEFFPRQLGEDDSNKLADRFQKHIEDHGYGFYAVELKKTGEFMGFAGLDNVDSKMPFAPAVEIAWRFDYGFWGSGYGTEAAMAILEHAFTKLKLKEIVGYAVHDNNRAIKLMEKIGMKHDPKGDFDYPGLPVGHPLGRFVLHRITKKQYQS
jgi:3-dehydroquinate dehydratase / shikimate dehydrogenase